ncbi:uncharacterized protein N7469_003744 [Penicillium citrinum]|uniref:Involucrin repeat protein n=1 Tax=Penicillium citrinum TaxID=5077 RepID=A0A9W9TPW1_PENCI|nr:uncharacterized protein N7469_003744 [Penicillium citrinum]KAJ5234576.1 hypothetical protein N7469_003744 [Penicillium citrinum]
MFKALMGGGNRSSSDVRSTTSSSSKSSRRKTDSKSSHSRKSSRGDDRDRGLGDLSAYEPSASGSRRGPASAAGDSVASFITAEPESYDAPDRIVERTPKRRDSDRESKSSRRRERTRDRSESRERERERERRKSRRATDDRDDELVRSDDPRERRRTHSGDPYMPPVSTAMPSSAPGAQFAADMAAPGFSQFPGQYDAGMPPAAFSPAHESTPSPYDPHVQQQFPGQFPTGTAQPYVPPNPAGAAADYYGDQGQSVQYQPGVRPPDPLVIPAHQSHLQAASPSSNPPPEPSSMGQVGAAAAYFDDAGPAETQAVPSKPTKPSKPSKPSSSAVPASAVATGAVGYGLGNTMSSYEDTQSQYTATAHHQQSASYSPPAATSSSKPPKPTYGIGAGVGAAAAGAAAGYMLGHQHHSSSPESAAQYSFQNHEEHSQTGLPPYGSRPPNAMVAAGGAGAGAAAYAAQAGHYHSHSHPLPHRPGYYPYAPGGLAYQHRHRGPLSKFVDFWRDPEGVGRFEDYTETIGVCKYCFDPHTSSVDAPRKHHYERRRHSSDRYSASTSSRVSKLSRYHSSDDESRRKRSKKSSSWLPGMLAGYAAKSIFAGKDFNDSYSVRSGRMAGDRASSYDGDDVSNSDRRSYTSRGVVRRSDRSPQRGYYSDSKHSHRPRSRSRSSSRSGRHSFVKEAALGAAVGGAALAVAKHHNRSRSRSPSRGQRRKESSSSSSFVDVSRSGAKSTGGFTSFFTAGSENRQRKRELKKSNKKKKAKRGFFSFNSSSSSSLDADLAFGSGFAKKSKSKKEKKKDKKNEDVNAALLGLGATATALAASSPNRRSAGQMMTRDSRSRHGNYSSSANEDGDWVDADSSEESPSSVSSALAFGGSSAESSSDSSSSGGGWGWRWGSKKDKKKKEKKSSAANAAMAAGAGALGGAAIASVARQRDSRPPSEAGSLQQVYPVPTSDPSRFDVAKMSPSVASVGPTPLVRPGPIPLQQPQPFTPVSQAVYTSQGTLPGSIPAYSAPVVPPIFANEFDQHDPRFQTSRDVDPRRPRRSDSSPVFPTQDTPSSLKRRSTTKDQASVSFNLTDEQVERERRLNRRDQRSREDFHDDYPVQMIDHEEEEARRDAERRERRRKDREEDERRQSEKTKDSSSWVEAAAVGAIGAAAVGAIASSSHKHGDDVSETSSRRVSRSEKRRAERRQGGETSSSIVSRSDLPESSERKTRDERDSRSSRKTTPSPVHDNYADFYAPSEIRHDEHEHHSRDIPEQPAIVEVMPASVRKARGELRDEDMSRFGQEPYENHERLPWPVPRLNYIDPTPPHSLNGSALGISTPTSAAKTPETEQVVEYVEPEEHVEHAEYSEPPEPIARKQRERSSTGSRVSWGEHSTHEYEVPSSSEQDPLSPMEDHPKEISLRDIEKSQSKDTSSKSGYGEDIEFAAIVAAGTEAAGFDPSFVIDDPKYHTRTSPPGSGDEGTFSPRSKWDNQSPEHHGFVEGEIGSYEPQSRDIESTTQPFNSESEPPHKGRDVSSPSKERGSIAQEVIEQLNGKQSRHDSLEDHDVFSMPGGFNDDLRDVEPRDDTYSAVSAPVGKDYEKAKSKKSRRSGDDFDLSRDLPRDVSIPEEAPAEPSRDVEDRYDSYSAVSVPVGKDYEKAKSKKSRRSGDELDMSRDIQSSADVPHTSSPRDVVEDPYDSRSAVSAPLEKDYEKTSKSRKSRRSGDDFELPRDVPADLTRENIALAEEDEGDDDKKKRRKRRSKRESDTFSVDDDARSAVTSYDDADKSERRKHRHRSSGLRDYDDTASITSSPAMVDETREKRRSKDEKRSKRDSDTFSIDDDARSVVTSYEDGDKSERRKHRHRSSSHRDFDDNASITSSPARIDETREKRRGKDEKEKSPGGFLRNIFGSRVSAPADDRNRSSSSLEKRSSREAMSEAGIDDERRRRKKHSSKSRSSSRGSRPDDSDKGDINLEEYRSRRQEKEERRRHRYEEIVESGKRRDYEKV